MYRYFVYFRVSKMKTYIYCVISYSCTFMFRISKIKTYIYFFRVVSFRVNVLLVKLWGLTGESSSSRLCRGELRVKFCEEIVPLPSSLINTKNIIIVRCDL